MSSAIEHPLVTEKAMNDMDFENKLQFVVNPDATKPEIRDEVEERFEISVENANTQVTMKGKKKRSSASPRRTTHRKSLRESGCSENGTTHSKDNDAAAGPPRSAPRRTDTRRTSSTRKRKTTISSAGRSSTSNTTRPAPAPIAAVEFDDGDQRLILAPEGITVGEELAVGVTAEIKPGNTLPLAEVPEGVPVCNVESNPGDGGRFARASGTNADLITHDRNAAVVQLPQR